MRPKLVFLILLFTWTKSFCQTASPDSSLLVSIEKARQLRLSDQYESSLDTLEELRGKSAFQTLACEDQLNFYYNTGVNYYYLDLPAKALVYLKDTALYRAIACWNDRHPEVGYYHYVIALVHAELNEHEEQAFHLEQSLSIQEQQVDVNTVDLADLMVEIARLNLKSRDYIKANRFLEGAERLYEEVEELDPDKWTRLNEIWGLSLYESGDFGPCIQKGELVLATDPNNSVIIHNLGSAYLGLGQLEEAMRLAERALAINRAKGDSLAVSFNLELRGTIFKRRNDFATALDNYQDVLSIRRNISNTDLDKYIANALENLGDMTRQQGEWSQAIDFYQGAIRELIAGAEDIGPFDNPIISDRLIRNRYDLARVLGLKAEAYLQLAENNNQPEALPAALEAYEKIDTLLHQIRQGLSDGGSKYILQEDIKKVYGEAVRSYLGAFDRNQDMEMLERAYQMAAKNKALVLLEGLQDERAKSFAGIPSSLLRQVRALRKDYQSLEAKVLAAGTNAPILTKGPDSLFRLRRAYQTLIKELETEFPRYYDLKYSFVVPISIQTLQEGVGEKSALIEYFVGEESIFIFLITDQEFRSFEVEKGSDFEAKIQAFRQIVEKKDPQERETQFSQLSYGFYQQLLAEPLAVLARDGKVKRLKIIPDEVLLQFPFDLLLTEPTSEGLQARTAPYLIRQYALSYSYSNQLAFADRRTQRRIKKARNGFAGFGLEYDDFTLKGLEGTGLDKVEGKNREIGRLKYSTDEVLSAAKILGGQAWVNQDATKAAFLEKAGQYRILHLAMHALVDDEYPLNSALIFSRAKDSTDFMLKASDVYNMQIGADLAVLSACNTGFGSVQKGEGVRSIARAFTYAGCDRLMATLWEASDFSTKNILLSFYERAKRSPNTPIDVLLQQAKLEYLKEAPPTFITPSYWAHLMILGDTLPLETTDSYLLGLNQGQLLIAVSLTLLLLFLAYRFFANGKVE